MSEAQVVNMMLHRKLESGSQYSRLIPNYLSIRHRFELPSDYSNTYDTLEFMAIWTNKYAYQFQKVANMLKGKNVLETVKNNYNFLYKHFQYKIDENLQQIYAPSAAWHYRKVGFDCKSFSVLAMALLLCQNIEASFVKVKLPGSNDWSHVYVQIPYQGSYLIIDATTHDNKEVNFIEKHEFNMNNLKHIGLASPYMDTPYLNLDNPSLACPGQACSCNSSGLSSPYVDVNNPYGMIEHNGLNAGISLDNVKSLFNGIDCIGGSAYTDSILKENVRIANQLFQEIITDINTSVVSSPKDIGSFVAEFKGMANLLKTAYVNRKSQKDWNSCSKANFDATIKVFDFFVTIGSASLDAWLGKYFNKKEFLQNVIYNNDAYINLELGFWGTGSGGLTIASSTQQIFNYELKETNIPAFELTPYTIDSYKSNNFNTLDYLKTLTTVLVTYTDVIGTGTTTGNGTVDTINENGSTGQYVPKKDDSNAGMGLFLGTLAIVGLATWGFSKMKDKGNSKTKN